MSIQYAGGTIISSTLTQSAGTRAELAQWVRDQLVLAGWTSAGSATDYQLTSATTPQSLACRVRSYDPGSGSCARLKFSNTGGTKTQTGDLFLLPAAAKVWRIIANKYQFFVFTPGGSAYREFACGGVPYLPAFLTGVTTECLWATSNATTDTDTGPRDNLRIRLGTAVNPPNGVGLLNGNLLDISNPAGSTYIGSHRLVASVGAITSTAVSGYRWSDGSLVVAEPLMCWGLTALTDEAKIAGQLWDAAVIYDSFPADTQITLDGRTFWAITGSNGGAAATQAIGTLFVAVT
jgi:hypothetical protein